MTASIERRRFRRRPGAARLDLIEPRARTSINRRKINVALPAIKLYI
jgi:hypothetical protein